MEVESVYSLLRPEARWALYNEIEKIEFCCICEAVTTL